MKSDSTDKGKICYENRFEIIFLNIKVEVFS